MSITCDMVNRVAAASEKRAKDYMGVRIDSYKDRLAGAKQSWWNDLSRLFKSYWSFQKIDVRVVRGKLTVKVPSHINGPLSIEVKGPAGNPTVYANGASKQFGPDSTLEDILYWVDGVGRSSF